MSLKELTKAKHTEAEHTPFMKAVFKKTMPSGVWKNFIHQKYLFYKVIEERCRRMSLLGNIEGIERTELLYNDYTSDTAKIVISTKQSTKEYIEYLNKLTQPNELLAHLYVWHMGDLFGGQMIKTLIEAPSTALDFDNVDELKEGMRNKLNDDMALEANNAFDWAIKIMDEFNNELSV